MDNLVQKYHTPDNMWTAWNVNSYEEFIKKFMVIGKFHEKVPSKIIKEYEIVERLLCYSYYHYPILDEAFSKVTRVFESSIKLRIEELGLPKPNRFESLENKIKKIEPFTSPSVMEGWNKARNVRNIFAHPKAGTIMGITILRGFFQMVNIINTIFLDKKVIEENEQQLEKLKRDAQHLKEGLLKFQIHDKNYLIWSIIPYSYFKTKKIEKSFWVFHPVFTNFPQTVDRLIFSLPICLRLCNVKIFNDGVEATVLNSGKVINAMMTDNPINKDLLKKHNEMILSSELKVKEIYWHHLETEISFELEKFLYYECWE